MKKPLEIFIAQSYLWDDSKYTYVWPYCLANADPNRSYSHDDLKEGVFGMVVKGASKANRSRDVRGIEIVSPDRVYVHGVSLFQKNSAGYVMTDDAREIADEYRRDPESDRWKVLLIQQVLKYDARVRSVVYYLGALDYSLVTGSAESTTASPAWRTKLVRDGSILYLYEKTHDSHMFDLINFTISITDLHMVLGLPEGIVSSLCGNVCAYCMNFALPESERTDAHLASTYEEIEFLSQVLAQAKAIAYIAADLAMSEEKKDAIEEVRRESVPYYFTEERLGKRASMLRSGELSIADSVKQIADQIGNHIHLEGNTGLGDRNDLGSMIEILSGLREKIRIGDKKAVLNMMIENHKNEIVGPYILNALKAAGIDIDRNILLRGSGEGYAYGLPFSRNLFSIPKALDLLVDLKMIQYSNESWVVNPIALMRLDRELVQGLTASTRRVLPIDDDYRLRVLKASFEATKMESGYVQARKLEREVAKRLDVFEATADFLCKLIRKLTYEGIIEVKYRDGLPVDGPGLCNESHSRLLTIAFPKDL